MTEDDAVALIGGRPMAITPVVWADLGCGDGTFTRALATLLPAGSSIHAIDQDVSALRRIPSDHRGVSIVTHPGDFTVQPWPFDGLDGVLLANSLHYVRDQPRFIRDCAGAMNHSGRFLVVEYDTEQANRWVPYPLSRQGLTALLRAAGFSSVEFLGSRPSIYRRSAIYSALVER